MEKSQNEKRIQEIESKIALMEKQKDNANLSPAMKKQVAEKIEKYKGELAELKESSGAKAAAKAAKKKPMRKGRKEKSAPKEKKPKAEKKDEPAPVPQPVSRKGQDKWVAKEGVKHQKLSGDYSLEMLKEDVYAIVDKNEKVIFELVRKDKNGKQKWEFQCKDKKEKSFVGLQGAVNYILKTMYGKESEELLEKRRAAKASSKKFRKENPTGKVPPAKAVKKEITQSVKKVKDKASDDEAIVRDINAMLSAFKEGVNKLTTLAKQTNTKVDKAEVKSLIAALKKLL